MIVDKVLNYLGEGNVEYLKNDMDPRNYRVNFEKIRSVLKFEPKYTIDDGIKEIANSIENKIFLILITITMKHNMGIII